MNPIESLKINLYYISILNKNKKLDIKKKKALIYYACILFLEEEMKRRIKNTLAQKINKVEKDLERTIKKVQIQS